MPDAGWQTVEIHSIVGGLIVLSPYRVMRQTIPSDALRVNPHTRRRQVAKSDARASYEPFIRFSNRRVPPERELNEGRLGCQLGETTFDQARAHRRVEVQQWKARHDSRRGFGSIKQQVIKIERVAEPDANAGKACSKQSHEILVTFNKDKPARVNSPFQESPGHSSGSRSKFQNRSAGVRINLRRDPSRQRAT